MGVKTPMGVKTRPNVGGSRGGGRGRANSTWRPAGRGSVLWGGGGGQVNGYRMPAESAPQDQVWMAFPSEGYSLGDTQEAKHEARSTWAAVAYAIAEFEPVTMVIDPGERAAA